MASFFPCAMTWQNLFKLNSLFTNNLGFEILLWVMFISSFSHNIFIYELVIVICKMNKQTKFNEGNLSMGFFGV